MRILAVLMLMAATFLATPLKAQMTLPQTRMYEVQRDGDRLNRVMKQVEETAKKQQQETQAHRVNYTVVALAVIAVWLYRRRQRLQAKQSPVPSPASAKRASAAHVLSPGRKA